MPPQRETVEDGWKKANAGLTLRPVSLLDWVIVAFTCLLAVYGYLQGFIVGALSLIGFGIGAFLGVRLGTAAAQPRRPLAVRAAVRAGRRRC